MDAKQAASLRAPFPPEAIGKLPKGGAMLDFVGHAAWTARLLQVDPEWSWEPMAYDMGGLPLFDGGDNLWIKLTICGVTRIGVGDGKSPKECIGDAIRNAAMRFGVALDLWAKEDLHAMDAARGTEAPAERPPATRTTSRRIVADAPAPVEPSAPDPAMSAPDADGITPKQLKAIHAGMGEAGLGERVAGLAFLSEVLGREVTTSKDLSKVDAGKVMDQLTEINQGIAPTDATPAVTNPNTELLAEIGALADKTPGGRKSVAADWAETHEGEHLRDATDLGGLELLRDDLQASAS